MAKWKMLFVLPLVVSVSGCASMAEGVFKLPSGALTQTYENPITKARLYKIQNALILGVTAMQSYKDLCEQRVLANNCIATVASLQGYVKKGRPLLRQLRVFVRKNDQVNARIVFTTLYAVIQDFRATATAAGITLPPQEAL